MSEAESEPKKKTGSGLVPALTVVILLLGGAAGGAWWWSTRANAASVGGDEKTQDEESGRKAARKRKAERGALIPLQPFLVNLADPDASRFLRCTLALVVEDEAVAAKFEGGRGETVVTSRLRSAILEILTTQNSATLVTTDGKQKLKAAVIDKANGLLPDTEVIDVLFSDFVVQF